MDTVKTAIETLGHIRRTFENMGEMLDCAYLYCGNPDAPELHMLAMPGADQQEARRIVQEQADKHGGIFVAVAHEIWTCTAPDAIPGRLHEHPDRGEAVIVFVESTSEDIKRYQATITRVDGKATLGEWREEPLKLPRPGFKRYLVEHLPDGKRLSAAGIRITYAPGKTP